jgi:dolichyl-phosphate beta-glucosyltransferase
MSADAPALTVIVPAFNEAQRIASPLREIAAYLAGRPYSTEIVVVDDGSSDGTAMVVREVAGTIDVPLVLVRYPRNLGKGGALKAGFAASRGEQVLFTDADLSTPIVETEGFLRALADGADVAIGSRKRAGAQILKHQPWHREQMGRVFTLLARLVIADVSDVTCGFKAYRGDAGRDVFARVRVFDWSFDAEMLWIAGELNLSVVEVPVRWQDRAGTKVSLLRDALLSLAGLFRIRWNAARGLYARVTDAADSGSQVEVWRSDAPAARPDSDAAGEVSAS